MASLLVTSDFHNKIPQAGWFKQQSSFSPSTATHKAEQSEVKAPADLVFGDASLLGMQMAIFWLFLYMVGSGGGRKREREKERWGEERTSSL